VSLGPFDIYGGLPLFVSEQAEIGLFYYGTPNRSKPIIFLPIDKFAKYNPPTSPMYCREELYPTVRAKGASGLRHVLRRTSQPGAVQASITLRRKGRTGCAMHRTCMALILNSRNGITEHQDGEA
jgi:hypothetical protein